MSFPNSAKGLSKVFTASILELILMIAVSVITSLSLANVPLVIALSVCLAIAVITLIINFKGLSLAAKDDKRFETAFQMNIAVVVVEIFYLICPLLVNAGVEFLKIFTKSSAMPTIFNAIADVFVVSGIVGLFDKQGDTKAASFGRAVTVLIVINGIIEVLMTFFNAGALKDEIMKNTGLLIAICAIGVFTIVVYILYLVLLRKAIRRFE